MSLLIIDEAARVPDILFRSVDPMLAVGNGRMAALSTPWGQRGWFWKEATSKNSTWRRWTVPWTLCPRMDQAFIDKQIERHGKIWVAQEHGCSFNESTDQAFAEDVLQRAVAEGIEEIDL